jgi:hypothetical protein
MACPIRSSSTARRFASAFLVALLGLGLSSPARAASLTRADAAAALMAGGSGVTLSAESTVWSPYLDFGAGPGFEGAVPAGTLVDPFELGTLPFPGPGMTSATEAYFFFIDDEPFAHFQHPVRFVFVDANPAGVPTVGNGGIVVSDQGWWPLLTPPGGPTLSLFDTMLERASEDPAGPTNPDGLIFGGAPHPMDLAAPPPPARSSSFSGGGTACGLIAMGPSGSTDPNFDFSGDTAIFEGDLTGHYGVPADRIETVNGGAAASKSDLSDAVDAIVAESPPCTKIYVRLSAHGGVGSMTFSDGKLTKEELCVLMKKLSKLGVPICLLLNGCHTESMLDPHNWDMPAGSSILTGASSDKSSWGGAFADGGGGCFKASLYVKAHSDCLNDTTDADMDGKFDADLNKDGIVGDVEAHKWLTALKPCWAWKGNGKFYYPAGPPTGVPGGDPGPTVTTVGTDPKKVNINVRNGTGGTKTEFCIVLAGDMTDAAAYAWHSNPGDILGAGFARGAGETTATYDPAKDRTTICWSDPSDPILPGAWLHIGVAVKSGLKPLKQWWGPTPTPPSIPDRVPTVESSIFPGDGVSDPMLRMICRSEAQGGDDSPVIVMVDVRLPLLDVLLEDLALGDPTIGLLPPVLSLPAVLLPDEPLYLSLPPTMPEGSWSVRLSLGSWGQNNNVTGDLGLFSPFDPVPWFDLEDDLGGDHGPPSLVGSGPLTPSSLNQVTVENGPPNGQSHLIFSLTQINAPFKGGVLVPLPEFLVLGLPLSQQGALALPFGWPNNFPAGFPFYVQFWMNDPSGPHGFTATNGLQGVSQ